MEWISVKERLPEEGGSVLVWIFDDGVWYAEPAFYDHDRHKYYGGSFTLDDSTNLISHWCRITPPQE